MAKPSFDPGDVERSLLHDIASSFNDSGTFPDYKVTLVGHKSWLCHKMVLIKRSGFFHDACTSKFKEGGDASGIELHEADPNVLEAALEFCYTVSDTGFKDHAHAGGMSLATFYVRLFHLAEFYRIKGLSGLATTRFISTINDGEISTKQLAEAFKEVYTITVDPEKLLRKAVIEKTLSNARFYLSGKCSPFSGLASDESDFALDMMEAMAQDRPEVNPIKLGEDGEVDYYCPEGGCRSKFTTRVINQASSDTFISHNCKNCHNKTALLKPQWALHAVPI